MVFIGRLSCIYQEFSRKKEVKSEHMLKMKIIVSYIGYYIVYKDEKSTKDEKKTNTIIRGCVAHHSPTSMVMSMSELGSRSLDVGLA